MKNNSKQNYIVIPYFDNNHWTLLVADLKDKTVWMANSLNIIQMRENEVLDKFS